MNERLRQIMYGEPVCPKTQDEEAVKYAVDNAGSGGGSSLPAVTTDDNGDVLKVVNGAWNKSAEQADAGIVTFSVSDVGGYTTDVSIEIINSMNNNIPIVCAHFPMENGMVKMPLVYSDDTTAVFSCVSLGQAGTTKNVLYGQNDGTSDSWQFISE